MHPVCCQCKQPIRRRIVKALDRYWHPKHFTCLMCRKAIDGGSYSVVCNEPICTDCHRNHYAERCCCCDKPIMERTVNAVDGKWHEDCFRCVYCGIALINAEFYELEGCIFCKEHFLELFPASCAGCYEPLLSDVIVALNTKWHRKCFKCVKCEQPIDAGKFAIEAGRQVCPLCARNQRNQNAHACEQEAAATSPLKRQRQTQFKTNF